MKFKKRYLTLLSVAALMGCSQQEEATSYDPSVMRFEAEMPDATRVTDTDFEAGDRIGLFVVKYNNGLPVPLQISGNHANNVATTFDGTAWEPAKRIYRPDVLSDAYAYYPHLTLQSVDEQPFSVALDQNAPTTAESLGGYEASDLLWAKTSGISADENIVSLKFRHRMSKLMIRLEKGPDYEGALPTNALLQVHNTVPDAILDLATGAVMKSSLGKPQTITCRKVSDALYEAIIVPQRLETRRPFIEMSVNGISYLLEDSFHFKPGTVHTVSLTINMSPDRVSVDIGGTVEGGWN